MKSTTHALDATAGLVTFAALLLLYFLFQRNFQVAYVASYTDTTLSAPYVISALWAGQKGSLLFWGWMLSLCGTIGLRQYQKRVIMAGYQNVKCSFQERKQLFTALLHVRKLPRDVPCISLIIALVLTFFLSLLVFEANPFRVLSDPPLEGQGMSPLLQNPYMVIHPPLLFLGYAGFILPFALAFAALCTGKIRKEWLVSMRRWVLFSWYFLGIGILLGGHWAYLELGWGGYWAWDPVENSSLIPWIAATALLHTLILQQRKGLLTCWNIFLSLVTFSLCVFGTFITRSGILESVHAYVESPTGVYFIFFLLLVFVCTFGLLAYRWRTFRNQTYSPAFISKETSFFLTNQILMGLGAAVLYGTLYPLLSELVIGKKALLDRSFFNSISIPLGLIILALIGLCQLFSWKRGLLKKKLFLSLGATIPVAILLFAFGMRDFLTLLTCSLGFFVVISILINVKTAFRPFSVFHVGMVVIFIGIAISSTYKIESDVTLTPGESSTLGHVRFEYVGLDSYEDAHKGVVVANVEVYDGEKRIATLKPEKRFYGQTAEDAQVTTEIGLSTSVKEDIYVILAGWDENNRATFRFMIHPMIIWIWLGGLGVFTLGMIVVAVSNILHAKRLSRDSTHD